MTASTTLRKAKQAALTLLVLLFWVAVWFLIALIVDKEILVASPIDVFKRLSASLADGLFRKSIALSIVRIFGGFFAGVIVSVLLALLTSFSKAAKALLEPMLYIIKSTPVASFILLALVWLDRQLLPTFIAFLMVLPILWANITAGIRETPKSLSEVADVFGASERQKIGFLYIPSAMPYFLAGCRSCLGLAWKAGVAAEVLCTPRDSLGRLLYESKMYYDTTGIFTYTLTVIVLSIVIEKLVIALLRPIERHFGA